MPWLEDQQRKTSEAFDYAVRCLFWRLMTWKVSEVHGRGIRLEIITDSESYWQKAAAKIRQHTRPLTLHVLNPQVLNGTFKERVLKAAGLDFHFSFEVHEMAWRLIPMVRVISSLSIRRKSIRHFDPKAIGHILSHLPNVRAFIWEVMPHGHWKSEHRFTDDLQKTVHLWPASLRMVMVRQVPWDGPPRRMNPHLQSLVSTLSTRFKDLEVISTYSSTYELMFAAQPANNKNSAEQNDRAV
ncbi:hypothetical protein ACHAQD_006735 [Fusarium lateritium]